MSLQPQHMVQIAEIFAVLKLTLTHLSATYLSLPSFRVHFSIFLIKKHCFSCSLRLCKIKIMRPRWHHVTCLPRLLRAYLGLLMLSLTYFLFGNRIQRALHVFPSLRSLQHYHRWNPSHN